MNDSLKRERRRFLRLGVAWLFTSLITPIISSASSGATSQNRSGKVLILYFSLTGTTQEIANQIQGLLGGDVFEVKPINPYPKEYRPATRLAKKEQEENFRPNLAVDIKNADAYDLIVLGYPTWWGTLPMALFTFFERHRFAGKTILPFCTHGGTGFGRGIEDIKSLCPNAKILEGLALRGGGVSNVRNDFARREIVEWLSRSGVGI